MTWPLALLFAFILGLTRGGIKGIAPLFVMLMILAFGGKASTGIIVPLLVIGDFYAMYLYRKHVNWSHVKSFMPWVIMGAMAGAFIGKDFSDVYFEKGISLIIMLSVTTIVIWELNPHKQLKSHWLTTCFTGLGSGIFSIIGNFAGTFANIYFLKSQLPRRQIIGTGTFVYLGVNIFKIPFHIYVWKSLTWNTLKIDFCLLPAMFVGILVGFQVIRIATDKWFRVFLLVVTFISALAIFIR